MIYNINLLMKIIETLMQMRMTFKEMQSISLLKLVLRIHFFLEF